MRIPETSRLLVALGCMAALAAAALEISLMSWWGYDLLRYAFSHKDPTWGEVGVIPMVVVLRLVVAAWVAWGAIRLDGRPLARTLLAASGVSFFLLYGWYFLLTRMDWGFLYWVVARDALCLAGGLAVVCALRFSAAGTRSAENNS